LTLAFSKVGFGMAASVLALVGATLATGACPASPGALAFEPATIQAPLMVVEGRIDPAGPVSIVFDTGATAPFDVFLSPTLATRLGLVLSDEVAPPDSTAVGPARQTYRTAHLDHFALGPVALKGTDVAVVPMIDAMQAQVGRRIDAIVGHHLIRDRIIAVDYPARRIDLAAAAGDDRTAIPFTLGARKPLVLVPVIINGQGPFQLEIDTGATGTTLSPNAAGRARIQTSGQGRLGGAGGGVDVGLGQAALSFGPVSRTIGVAVSPAIGAIAASAGSQVDGILGGDFFSGTCLTIDYPRSRLWLTVP
jgi:predicted aspartyl protease